MPRWLGDQLQEGCWRWWRASTWALSHEHHAKQQLVTGGAIPGCLLLGVVLAKASQRKRLLLLVSLAGGVALVALAHSIGMLLSPRRRDRAAMPKNQSARSCETRPLAQ